MVDIFLEGEGRYGFSLVIPVVISTYQIASAHDSFSLASIRGRQKRGMCLSCNFLGKRGLKNEVIHEVIHILSLECKWNSPLIGELK